MTKKKRRNKPLSLYPLKPEDVLKELLQIKPDRPRKNRLKIKNRAQD